MKEEPLHELEESFVSAQARFTEARIVYNDALKRYHSGQATPQEEAQYQAACDAYDAAGAAYNAARIAYDQAREDASRAAFAGHLAAAA